MFDLGTCLTLTTHSNLMTQIIQVIDNAMYMLIKFLGIVSYLIWIKK